MFNDQASTTVQFQYCEHNYSILPIFFKTSSIKSPVYRGYLNTKNTV